MTLKKPQSSLWIKRGCSKASAFQLTRTPVSEAADKTGSSASRDVNLVRPKQKSKSSGFNQTLTSTFSCLETNLNIHENTAVLPLYSFYYSLWHSLAKATPRPVLQINILRPKNKNLKVKKVSKTC